MAERTLVCMLLKGWPLMSLAIEADCQGRSIRRLVANGNLIDEKACC